MKILLHCEPCVSVQCHNLAEPQECYQDDLFTIYLEPLVVALYSPQMMTPDSCAMCAWILVVSMGVNPSTKMNQAAPVGTFLATVVAQSLAKANFKPKIALSTFHAKYVMLSSAFHQLIVLQCILQDLVKCLGLDDTQTPDI